MFKRILVHVDPARSFDAANRYAVDLAHAFESGLVATYIIDEHLMGHAVDEAANSLDHALEWVGQAAMEDFVTGHPDLDVKKTLGYGPTPTALFQVVLQSGADAVVVGGFHSTAQPHVWGSICADIVHHAERPVFVVRKDARLPGPEQPIVVPFDASERAVATLPRIADLATGLGAPIHLVHVAKPKHADKAQGILDRGAWILKEHGIEATMEVVVPKMFQAKAKAIYRAAKGKNAALIALSRLGTHSIHTGRSRTVGWLVGHSTLPVWVVRK